MVLVVSWLKLWCASMVFLPLFLCFDLSSLFSNYNEERRHIKKKRKTLKIHQNSNYNIIDDIIFFWQDESNISNKDHQRWWLKWVTFIVKGKWVICHLLVANVANVAHMGHYLVTFLSVIVFVLSKSFRWYWLCRNQSFDVFKISFYISLFPIISSNLNLYNLFYNFFEISHLWIKLSFNVMFFNCYKYKLYYFTNYF
jgi:hypothetical protein